MLLLLTSILIIGQIMSLLSPSESIDNYYTSRGNLINRYFVKLGWFWTISVYFNILFNKVKRGFMNKRLILISFLRVGIITAGWFIFTQWFFGLPIMDRVFIFTGGSCTNISENRVPTHLKSLIYQSVSNSKMFASEMISSASCRLIRGSWDGGHDPSGHIFLLTISINLLVWETVVLWSNEFESLYHMINQDFQGLSSFILQPFIITIIFVLVEMMMFMMTVIKYHTLIEQVGGFMAAIMVLWISNYLTDIFSRRFIN